MPHSLFIPSTLPLTLSSQIITIRVKAVIDSVPSAVLSLSPFKDELEDTKSVRSELAQDPGYVLPRPVLCVTGDLLTVLARGREEKQLWTKTCGHRGALTASFLQRSIL